MASASFQRGGVLTLSPPSCVQVHTPGTTYMLTGYSKLITTLTEAAQVNMRVLSEAGAL